MRDIVQVDRRCLSLQVLDALDTNLSTFNSTLLVERLPTILAVIKLIDAALLAVLILLCFNDVSQTYTIAARL